jgi:polar amino acid transport system substrate-binding protein
MCAGPSRQLRGGACALAFGRNSPSPLITDRFPLADAVAAYEKVESAPGSLGVLLQYPTEKIERSKVLQLAPQGAAASGSAVVGVIGAGNFAQGILLPALQKTSPAVAVEDLNAMAAVTPPRSSGSSRR